MVAQRWKSLRRITTGFHCSLFSNLASRYIPVRALRILDDEA